MAEDRNVLLVTVAGREHVAGSFLYHSHGNKFLSAAQNLSGPAAQKQDLMGDSGWPLFAEVIIHLYCHAMELYLKAFLSQTGCRSSELKRHNLGHNLVALQQKSAERGLQFPDYVSEVIAAVAPLHSRESDYLLRYPSGSGYNLPTPFEMNIAANHLHTATKPSGC